MQGVRRRAVLGVAALAGATWAGGGQARSLQSELVQTYLAAWRARDLDAILACMHPDLRFTGPNVTATGLAAYRTSTSRFLAMLESVEVRAWIAERQQAMIAYDFHCRPPVGAAPTAEWIVFRDGLIGSSEIFFDVRPFDRLARGPSAPATTPHCG